MVDIDGRQQELLSCNISILVLYLLLLLSNPGEGRGGEGREEIMDLAVRTVILFIFAELN